MFFSAEGGKKIELKPENKKSTTGNAREASIMRAL